METCYYLSAKKFPHEKSFYYLRSLHISLFPKRAKFVLSRQAFLAFSACHFGRVLSQIYSKLSSLCFLLEKYVLPRRLKTRRGETRE